MSSVAFVQGRWVERNLSVGVVGRKEGTMSEGDSLD